jgi:hypothetical protein
MKIILTDSNKHVSSYLKDETKFFPYEIYFSDEIKAAGCEALKHLNNLPEIDTNDNNVGTPALSADRQNLASLQTIEKVHRELSNPSHPVSIAMAKMRDIPEVKYPAAMAGQDSANFHRANFEVLTRGAI